MKKPLPTDLEILDEIYERYYDAYADQAEAEGSQYILIDVPSVAQALKVPSDLVFGRLRHHFDQKLRYGGEDLSPERWALRPLMETRFFDSSDSKINFPYMASVLADLRAAAKDRQHANELALWALVLSGVAILVSALVGLLEVLT